MGKKAGGDATVGKQHDKGMAVYCYHVQHEMSRLKEMIGRIRTSHLPSASQQVF